MPREVDQPTRDVGESFEDFAMEQLGSLTEIATLDLKWQRGIEQEIRDARTRDMQLFVCVLICAVLALIAMFR